MIKPRRFRFGARAGPRPVAPDDVQWSGPAWRDAAKRAEAQGYAWITVPDHVVFPIAPIAAMMAMADATVTLRVTSTVLDNNLRHPVMLAKEAAMIDVLSEGRFELGIGAGSLPFEHAAYLGMPPDSIGVRLRRLEEALTVLKGMWGPSTFSIDGEFYTCEPIDGLPKPVQQPHPPIRVGGFGKRLLTLAAREADIVSILARSWPNQRPGTRDGTEQPARAPTAADVKERVHWIRTAAGDRVHQLELELRMGACVVTDDPVGTAASRVPALGASVDEVLSAPDVAIGPVSFVAERLEELRESYGISSFLGVPPEVVAVLADR